MTVHPIPPGYTSLTPFLCVDGASAAIDFYTGVFGIGNGRLQLGDPADAYGTTAPDARSDVVTRAREAGATVRQAPQNFATGDRFASLRDPFGIRWTVMTRIEDITPEERDRRLGEWAKENVG